MDGSDVDNPNVGGRAKETPIHDDAVAESASSSESIIEPVVSAAVESVSTVAAASVNGVPRETHPERLSSILVAVGSGPHSGATVDIAREIAEATDAWLELFHVVSSDDALADSSQIGDNTAGMRDETHGTETAYTANGERLLSAAKHRLGGFDRVDRWLVEDLTAAGAIVEQSPYYDLVVVGATTTGTVGRFVFGSTTDTVVDDAAVPVIVVEAAGSTALCDV